MKRKYWRVVCRYGHVGLGKEISVARFIETSAKETCMDVFHLASLMPGVKSKGVLSVEPVTPGRFISGKKSEQDNRYLQRLFQHKKKSAAPKPYHLSGNPIAATLRKDYKRSDPCAS